MSEIVLSVGSNLGDRLGYLRLAADLARATAPLRGLRWSPVYETEPVGGPAQDDYLNAVLVAETDLEPTGVLRLAQSWEAAAGRERTERWGPRTLDVDVISVDAIRSHTPELTLPHPRAHERAFVLVPWLDVDPAAELVGRGRVADLVRKMDTSGVRRWSR